MEISTTGRFLLVDLRTLTLAPSLALTLTLALTLALTLTLTLTLTLSPNPHQVDLLEQDVYEYVSGLWNQEVLDRYVRVGVRVRVRAVEPRGPRQVRE